MSAVLLVAASLVLFIGVAHSVLGERFVLPRLLALPDLPLLHRDRRYTTSVLRYAWHLTSLAWWGLAGILIVVAVSGPSVRNVGAVVAGTLLLSAVVILVTAGRRHPAWSLFLLAGAAAWYGTW